MKSSIRDKAEGTFHEVKGKVKEVAGKVSDNPELEGERPVRAFGGGPGPRAFFPPSFPSGFGLFRPRLVLGLGGGGVGALKERFGESLVPGGSTPPT